MDSCEGNAAQPIGFTRLTTMAGESFNIKPAVVESAWLSSKAVPRMATKAAIARKRRVLSEGYRERSLTDQANKGKEKRKLSSL
jgi:hypothetical protein